VRGAQELAKSTFKTLQKRLNTERGSPLRSRRGKKLLTNIAIISVFSAITAFVITRQSGGAGFSLPRIHGDAAASAVTSAPDGTFHPENASKTGAVDIATDGYKLETGPLAVTEVPDIVVHDPARNKDLHLRIFYPVTQGKYPVIVFSHGAGGSQNCCESLTRHWATYGYVTLQPTHDDSIVQRRKSGDEALRFPEAVREALKNPALWESRPQDISFLLNALPDLQKRVGGLSDKLDLDRIGVAGHSMGSYTAEAVAGAIVDLPGRPATSFSDPRAKAILCLSPQGPSQFGLTARSFDKITLPFMGITGSLDSLGPVASPAWHKIPFERCQPDDKYELFIAGANHMSFITAETLLPARSSQAAAILGYTNSASLAFWDAYLKEDPAAKQFLQSDAMERSSHGNAKLSRR
jgi:predicted dienelactone hydrolase